MAAAFIFAAAVSFVAAVYADLSGYVVTMIFGGVFLAANKFANDRWGGGEDV